uniref:Uncharacterized protein n=1 Tax=Acrobeloides nanus TaxID=290746 RepID=A0A914ECD8_9BILA
MLIAEKQINLLNFENFSTQATKILSELIQFGAKSSKESKTYTSFLFAAIVAVLLQGACKDWTSLTVICFGRNNKMSAYPMTCNLAHVRRVGAAATSDRRPSITNENNKSGPGGSNENSQKNWGKSSLPQPPNFTGLFSKIQTVFNVGFVDFSTKPLNGIQDGTKLTQS